jgi:hypothetical protein
VDARKSVVLRVKKVERLRQMEIVGTDEGAWAEKKKASESSGLGRRANADLVFHPKLVHSMK